MGCTITISGTPLLILQAAPRATGLSLHQEAMRVSCQERIVAHHVIDAATERMATTIALCRHAWLRSASLSEDARACIKELPFDGFSLFSERTDNFIDNLQKPEKQQGLILHSIIIIHFVLNGAIACFPKIQNFI